jgi:uncharacterized protein YukE
MNKDKKIETQRKIIFSLQEENKNLKERIEELEFQLQYEKEMKATSFEETKKLLAEASEYRKKYQECIDGLNDAKKKYFEAAKQMNEEKKKYKKAFDDLLKTIKKNT